MKEKSLFKISVIFADYERIIFRNLLPLNIVVFILSFLPFLCAPDLKSNQMNLYDILTNFSAVWAALSWHFVYGQLLLILLLALPFFFFLAFALIVYKNKNYSRSALVSAFLSSEELNARQLAMYYIALNLAGYFAIGVFMTIWYVVVIFFEGIRTANNLVPASGFMLAYIAIFYFLNKIKRDSLRRFNKEVILDTSIEFLVDFGEEGLKKSLESTPLNTNREKLNFLFRAPALLKNTLHDSGRIDLRYLVNTNLFAEAFPEIAVYLKILFPAAANPEYPPVHLLDAKSGNKIPGFSAGDIPPGGSKRRNLLISRPSRMHARAELFTTCRWLSFSEKAFEYHELPSKLSLVIDSTRVKHLENGSIEKDKFYLIEYEGDKMMIEELFARIQIETKPDSIRRHAAWTAGLTILFYIFWVWSDFPYFSGLFRGMNADDNGKLLLGILAVYLLGAWLSSGIVRAMFKYMPVSKLKVVIVAFISSFVITFANGKIKEKYGYFISDQPSGFIMAKKSANIRYEPSRESGVVYEAGSGEEVKIRDISADGEWYHVYFGESWIRDGYIHRSLLKVDSTATFQTGK